MSAAGQAITSREVEIEGTQFYGDVTQRTRWHGVVLSELVHPRPRSVPFHEHEHSYFTLMLDGQYAEGDICIAPYTVSFLPMGARHDGRIGDTGGNFFTVEISEHWLEGLSGRDFCSPVLQARGNFLWAAMRLYQNYRENHVADALLLDELIMELAACAARERMAFDHARPLWLGRVIDFMESNCCDELDLQMLAREAGVHAVHLERTFRRFTGTTLGRHLHNLRIRRACQLLNTPEIPLAEIATQTGFADQPHFSRIFRRCTGTTPGRFRARSMTSRRKSQMLS